MRSNAQGELYLTDTIAHIVAGGRTRSRLASVPTRSPGSGSTRASSWRSRRAALRDRINEAHMLAGVTIVDPRDHLDRRRRRRSRPTRRSTRSRCCAGSTAVAAGAEIGPHASPSTPRSAKVRLVGPFCYLRPGTVLEAGAKAGTFVEIKNSRIGARHEGAPPLVHRRRRHRRRHEHRGAGNVTANFSHDPGRPKGKTTIGKNVRTGVDNTFVAPVTVGDDAWLCVRERSSPTTSRRDRSRDSPRGRRPRKDGSTSVESAENMATTELARLPGLEAVTEHAQPAARPLDRARPAEAPDGLLRALTPGPRAEHRREARRRARRDRASGPSRTTRRTAATTSRSAAPTSSSSRPAARRWTRT